jgi:hypothetical protein
MAIFSYRSIDLTAWTWLFINNGDAGTCLSTAYRGFHSRWASTNHAHIYHILYFDLHDFSC